MINHTYKDLYNQESIKKNITITYDGGQITNSDLYSESMEIKESLCSESKLTFGCCEASVLSIKIANISDSLKGKWLDVKETLRNESTVFNLGKYKVYSDIPSAERNYRNIVAYDLMYDVINSDVAEWYNGLEFPLTQKQFRDSFFNYLGITQETTSLIHDGITIEKTIDATSISGKSIINSLCELNGVFGHINRNNNFEYISLDKNANNINVNVSLVKSCEYEDFITGAITKLQIRQEDNDIGVTHGSGDNCYIIQNNMLVYGKTIEELESICSKLYNKISGVTYRPYRGVIRGNPCYMVGDSIKINTKNIEIQSFVFERTLSGIQNLMDTFEAKGVSEYLEDVNSLENEIIQLKGKTNVLIRDIDKTLSEIKDIENGLRAEIEQTAGGLRTEIEDVENGLKTQINQTASGIRSEVESVENGLRTEIEQSANGIRTEIEDVENGLKTQINQTAGGLRTEIEDVEKGLKTQIEESAEGIKIDVQASIKVGAANLLRNSRTLEFEDYYF